MSVLIIPDVRFNLLYAIAADVETSVLTIEFVSTSLL